MENINTLVKTEITILAKPSDTNPHVAKGGRSQDQEPPALSIQYQPELHETSLKINKHISKTMMKEDRVKERKALGYHYHVARIILLFCSPLFQVYA